MNFLSFFAKGSVFLPRIAVRTHNLGCSRPNKLPRLHIPPFNSKTFQLRVYRAGHESCKLPIVGIVTFLIRSCIVPKLDLKKREKKILPLLYFSDSRGRDMQLARDTVEFVEVCDTYVAIENI